MHVGGGRVSDFFAGLLDSRDVGEYYREPGLSDAEARELLLADTVLPDGLSVEEEREACRALKGSMLRQEVFARDGTAKQPHPYVVTEQNFTIRPLQPRAGNRHAVFFAHPHEAISYHYERDPTDPRITHTLTLDVDAFGNVRKSASVGYGRRHAHAGLQPPDQAKQGQLLVTYTENAFTNLVNDADAYRTPLPSESLTYEVTGYTPSGPAGRFAFADIVRAGPNGPEHVFDSAIDYHEAPTAGRQRRLIEHVMTLYRSNDLTACLSLGQLQSRALPCWSAKLAQTPALTHAVYGDRVTPAMLADDARYAIANGHCWVPSGQAFLSPDTTDDPAQELAYAMAHFFQPQRFVDPFQETTFVAYDRHDLLVVDTRDPLGNRVTAGDRAADGSMEPRIDYRVLQPALVSIPTETARRWPSTPLAWWSARPSWATAKRAWAIRFKVSMRTSTRPRWLCTCVSQPSIHGPS